jgi:hypothetical protein
LCKGGRRALELLPGDEASRALEFRTKLLELAPDVFRPFILCLFDTPSVPARFNEPTKASDLECVLKHFMGENGYLRYLAKAVKSGIFRFQEVDNGEDGLIWFSDALIHRYMSSLEQ